MAATGVHRSHRLSHEHRHGSAPPRARAPATGHRRSGTRGAHRIIQQANDNQMFFHDLDTVTEQPTKPPSRPATAASSLAGGSHITGGTRPGTSVSLRLESRLQSIPGKQVPSRPSTCSSRRTLSRPGWRSRPTSTLPTGIRDVPPESNPDRAPGMTSEGESDVEDSRTPSAAMHGLDILDFGGVDIFTENGWDTDLEEEPEVKESFDVTGRTVYIESCKHNGIIPASYFLRHMKDSHLKMKHHGLGPKGVKPIAVALVSNTCVLRLSLTDNWLGNEGGRHLCEMLKENCYITELDLSDNQLGVSFAENFTSVLNNNSTLTHVTLTGNFLDDKAAIYLADAIMNTTRLEYLNLSRNKLGEVAGVALGPAIAENSSIKHLDLSWNHLRRKGAIAVAQGIKHNVLMQSVNLSWNGVGNDGAKALGDALKVNSALEELDITNNRITTEGSVFLGKGIAVNESLKVLKMARNPMQSAGCYAICAAMLKNPNSIITSIDFSDILVNSDFGDILKKVREQLPALKVRTGGDGVPLRPKAKLHPMTKLTNYIEKNNLRLVDFFRTLDKDGSMGVTREEFSQGLAWIRKESGIKMTDDEINLLLDELDKDNDGEINYSELVIGHQGFTEKEKKMASTIMSLPTS
ncbi:hypothetical protein CAPTEDRAFT_163530 [Capitella teleta]|uniref:EF-hand domain-containing protein n=1 Tax=Capitella teleta TaxID=283909 RepID=R7VGU9_CAPTE|nr:hypothetical protein CAPTEDRAFT_163530 [Capitella teleta]|eukprot:ELU14920.1 hypothetical protein CAPTEDRAFT_163530 [Capitella teleta]